MNTKREDIINGLKISTESEVQEIYDELFPMSKFSMIHRILDECSAVQLDDLWHEICGDEAGDVRAETQRQRLLDQLERSICGRTGRTQ
jgi:hypothetical protein